MSCMRADPSLVWPDSVSLLKAAAVRIVDDDAVLVFHYDRVLSTYWSRLRQDRIPSESSLLIKICTNGAAPCCQQPRAVQIRDEHDDYCNPIYLTGNQLYMNNP